jgi:hypothetical protein
MRRHSFQSIVRRLATLLPPLAIGALIFLASLLGGPAGLDIARAERVITSPRVRTYVFVREFPVSGSEAIGTLYPNEEAVLVESTPGWYKVKLLNEAEGYVSARWTRVIPGPDFCHAQDDAECVK